MNICWIREHFSQYLSAPGNLTIISRNFYYHPFWVERCGESVLKGNSLFSHLRVFIHCDICELIYNSSCILLCWRPGAILRTYWYYTYLPSQKYDFEHFPLVLKSEINQPYERRTLILHNNNNAKHLLKNK